MRRATDDELESYLAGAAPGTRSELDVDQIAPFAQRGAAYVPIEHGHEDAARARVAALPEALRYVLAVVDTDEARAREPEFFDALAPGVTALRIGHDADRTYAGYGPIVNELRSLASLLARARWTIAELQGDWIDDFSCEGGTLVVRRWYGTEDAESTAAALEEIAGDDEELRRHARTERVREAESRVFEAFYASERDRAIHAGAARRELDRAGSLPSAQAQRAMLALVTGDSAEADRLAKSALEREDLPVARFVASLLAFSADREDDAREHAVRAIARAPWMAEARLLALGSNADDPHARALVDLSAARWTAYPGHLGGPWDRLRLALLVRAPLAERLDTRLLEVARFASDKPKGAALLFFTYGEALRLAGAHERARPFYERALEFDSLNGEIEKRLAWLRDRR